MRARPIMSTRTRSYCRSSGRPCMVAHAKDSLHMYIMRELLCRGNHTGSPALDLAKCYSSTVRLAELDFDGLVNGGQSPGRSFSAPNKCLPAPAGVPPPGVLLRRPDDLRVWATKDVQHLRRAATSNRE